MKIPFTASARTAMLIGSENFSNPEGAIIELVKNTYDADSAYCYILFDGTDEQITDIYIIDYGCGMDISTIQNCWMWNRLRRSFWSWLTFVNSWKHGRISK